MMMMSEWVKECRHLKIRMEVVGFGSQRAHQMWCDACGVRARSHPIPSIAIKEFDKKVKECRRIEEKEGQPIAHDRRRG